MNKLMLILSCLLVVAGISSCRKTYTCNCAPVNDLTMTATGLPKYEISVHTTTKGRAQRHCNEQQNELSAVFVYKCSVK